MLIKIARPVLEISVVSFFSCFGAQVSVSWCDCNIVTLLTVYNSVTVVQIGEINYSSD